MSKDEYLKGAIAEVLRVNRLRPNFTYLDYQDLSTFPYKGDQIRDRTGLKLNDIKVKAGLTIGTQRGKGSKSKLKGKHRYTDRICNVESCSKPFIAVDHMRSCPACDNAKKYGDGFGTGFDELEIGSPSGMYR